VNRVFVIPTDFKKAAPNARLSTLLQFRRTTLREYEVLFVEAAVSGPR
jgi:hypothetical protein